MLLQLENGCFNSIYILAPGRVISVRSTSFNFALYLYETLCTICQHLYNLKNMKSTHGGVISLLKTCFQQLHPTTKSNTTPCVFFTFFRLCKWYQIDQRITYIFVAFFLFKNFNDNFITRQISLKLEVDKLNILLPVINSKNKKS